MPILLQQQQQQQLLLLLLGCLYIPSAASAMNEPLMESICCCTLETHTSRARSVNKTFIGLLLLLLLLLMQQQNAPLQRRWCR